MRKLFVFLTVTMIGVFSAFAENTVIGLVVQESDKSPIVGANILIKNTDGKILAYGISANDGRFSIRLSSTKEQLSIHATMMGYKPYSAPLVLDDKPIEIRMQEGELQLREVLVKADRIRENGDTITYTVSSFGSSDISRDAAIMQCI